MNESRTKPRGWKHFAACAGLTLIATILIAGPFAACTIQPVPLPPPTPPQPFSGQAALVLGNINGGSITVGDTGELPTTGGAIDNAVLEVEIPGTLSAEVISSSVVGQGLMTRAEAALAKLDMTIAGQHITSDFVISRAEAHCDAGAAAVSGDFQIKELKINDVLHSVTTEPNSSVTLINQDGAEVGRITFNEQKPTTNGDTGEMVVNAMHVEVFGVADIQVGHARAAIKCPPPTEPIEPIGDFVTGGGFIEIPDGFAANFGVAGGLRKDGSMFGHLVYIDHGTDLKVKGTGVTAYTEVNETTRRIEGTCEVNQVGGFTYTVEVADNGEPGINDTFAITLSSGYTASGTLVGGNIQLHKEPAPAP
jgi:hypothetical protein